MQTRVVEKENEKKGGTCAYMSQSEAKMAYNINRFVSIPF